MRDCEQEAQIENLPKPEELKCGLCKALDLHNGKTNCEKHGEDFIEYKCKYCCQFAVWHCWGTTHFCEPCHRNAGENKIVECNRSTCPLKGNHIPNGEEFALGCKLCKDEYIDAQNIDV